MAFWSGHGSGACDPLLGTQPKHFEGTFLHPRSQQPSPCRQRFRSPKWPTQEQMETAWQAGSMWNHPAKGWTNFEDILLSVLCEALTAKTQGRKVCRIVLSFGHMGRAGSCVVGHFHFIRKKLSARIKTRYWMLLTCTVLILNNS